MKTGGSGAECLEVGKMNNFESEKKNPPVEVIDDVLEQVSGGISEPVEFVGSGGPIEPCKEMVEPIIAN